MCGPGKFIKPSGARLGSGESYVADQNTYYYYKGKTYLETTTAPFEMLFKNPGGSGFSAYWLASSWAAAYEILMEFGIRYVVAGEVTDHQMWNSYEEDCGFTGGVRAVVYLNSDVKLVPYGEHSWNLTESE